MTFCAQCITRPASHIDDEGYHVCDDCDYGAVRAHDATRGYQLREPSVSITTMGETLQRNLDRLAPAGEAMVRTSRLEHARNNTPGHLVVRLATRVNGRRRDAREAFEREIAHEPWAPEVRHVVTTPLWHVFERPDPAVGKVAPSTNPLMWIEAYRVGGGR